MDFQTGNGQNPRLSTKQPPRCGSKRKLERGDLCLTAATQRERTCQLTPKLAIAVLVFSLPLMAQAPSTETLLLSLKTMSKAFAGCRATYTRPKERSAAPLLEEVIGIENYSKGIASLNHAERVTNFLVAHPAQISGKALVVILSTSDDFSVGVGSTRASILSRFADPAIKISGSTAMAYASAAAALDNCQKNIFNAGDDYVGLVMGFVGAEDDALIQHPHR